MTLTHLDAPRHATYLEAMTFDLGLAGMTLLAAIAVWLAPILLASLVTGIAHAIRTLDPRPHLRLGGGGLDGGGLGGGRLDEGSSRA